jgi:hypothetical protein
MLKISRNIIIILLIHASNAAMAGFFDSKLLEPMILGTVGSVVSISSAPTGDQTQDGAIGFAVGALIGYGINSYYDTKFSSKYKNEADALKRELDDFKLRDAQNAASGLRSRYGIIRQERVDSQKLENGAITSPYFIEYYSTPGASDDFVGQ